MKRSLILVVVAACGGDDPSATPDAAAADAALDGPAGVLEDGSYRATTWTCAGGSGTVDVIAFATSIQIAQIRLVVNGTDGQSESDSTGSPVCTRTIGQTYSYPSAGTVTLTSDASFTCSASCPAQTCTSGAQPVIVDTFQFLETSASPTTYSFTRTLPPPVGLQLAAGCQAGGAEDIVWQRL